MRSVPQSKYTSDYYEHCCEGFTEDGLPGRRIRTLLSHAGRGVGLHVLDIGCGRGEVAKWIGGMNQVVSLDYSFAASEFFYKNNGDTQPIIIHDASKGFPWIRSEYFDLVVLADVVEHVYPEQLKIIGIEVVRVSAPGALILIDTPIMKGGESELHVDIKESAQEVHSYFPYTRLVNTHWHKKPEHCNIILQKDL